ncbi:MAG: PaaI family thioesterase [Novosphingobium sp.]|nr:PaaI family thioesterase [Novosphingobium sp.]
MSEADEVARVAAGLPPYAVSLGIGVERIEAGAPLLTLDFAEKVHGRPGFLHGGAIGGLLEMAAIAALRMALAERGAVPRLKPVNMTVEFLRGGTDRRTYALGRVTRAGRRIANVSAEAWQDDPARPIATAWMNVLLSGA